MPRRDFTSATYTNTLMENIFNVVLLEILKSKFKTGKNDSSLKRLYCYYNTDYQQRLKANRAFVTLGKSQSSFSFREFFK